MEDQYIVPTVVSRGEVMFTALGDRDDTEMVAMANTCVKGCDHGDRLTDRPDHRDCPPARSGGQVARLREASPTSSVYPWRLRHKLRFNLP